MFRALTTFTVAVCLTVPVLAAQRPATTPDPERGVHIPAEDYQRWQQMGFSSRDIFYAYNASAHSGRPVSDILEMRRQGQSWERISQELRVPSHLVYGVPPGAVAGERVETRRRMPPGAVAGERLEVRRDGMPPGLLSPYPLYERPLPDAFYRDAYRLTPREYYRFRAMGLSQEQVFMVANAARVTGLEPRIFIDAILRGMTPRMIAYEYVIDPLELIRVIPEWRTPEWAAAVNEPVYDRQRLGLWW